MSDHREPYWFGHVLFELTVAPETGAQFALVAGEADEARHRRPLFTGFIHAGMAAQLRALADRVEEIEGCGRDG
ncbi:hypothetical protein [Pukyongiella litopenaei]|uniref:Uncharacterized protein n=1 Tax=Pukyongiella litopenaei TaxID=2605946 RepID=A0A2S0MLH0_9RHOB|nr:hypothetical protein [Pukyongiella litopenaei]AVO36611.1 hypothetical protein C6Y53_02125 [Pukyongiella litopenaei]